MRILLIIFISFFLSSCAKDTIKNDQAKKVVKAGDELVKTTTSFYDSYLTANEDFITVFYITTPECSLRTDYVIFIRKEPSKDRDKSICLTPHEVDQYRLYPKDERDKYYTEVRLVFDKVVFKSVMEIINSLSSYTAALSEGLDTKDSSASIYLKKALDDIEVSKKIISSLKIKDADAAEKTLMASSELYDYLNILYKSHKSALKVESIIVKKSDKVNKSLEFLKRDLIERASDLNYWQSQGLANKFNFYNKFERSKMKLDDYTKLSNLLHDDINKDMRFYRFNPEQLPEVLAIENFINQEKDIRNIYSGNLSENQKKELTKARIDATIEALKQIVNFSKPFITALAL